jgi:PIN domain nuclease of toxin-antitoxin system
VIPSLPPSAALPVNTRRLLLDSHVLLWWLTLAGALKARTRHAIVRAEEVYVSAVSVWELSIKAALGNLHLPEDLEEQIQKSALIPLPVTMAHGIAAAKLPPLHKDPFDRMLVAQASLESLTLLTADARLQNYGVAVMLA